MKEEPQIFAITEAGDKIPIQAKNLLICLNNKRNIEIVFNHPSGEITLLSYHGEKGLYPSYKMTDMTITPGACNVIHINITAHDLKPLLLC